MLHDVLGMGYMTVGVIGFFIMMRTTTIRNFWLAFQYSVICGGLWPLWLPWGFVYACYKAVQDALHRCRKAKLLGMVTVSRVTAQGVHLTCKMTPEGCNMVNELKLPEPGSLYTRDCDHKDQRS